MESVRQRVEKLEGVKEPLKIIIIWESLDKPGVYYYDGSRSGEVVTPEEMERFRREGHLIRVTYDRVLDRVK